MARLSVIAGVVALIALASCEKKSQVIDPPVDTTASRDTTLTHISDTVHYGDMSFDSSYSSKDCGTLGDTRIREASGLAASSRYSGMFWTHNDSDNPNEIFLIDSTARTRADILIVNTINRDWEDIEVGPGPVTGTSYIYLADIGDNDFKHTSSTIYRFPEPDMRLDTGVVYACIAGVQSIAFSYADGKHDAESLLLDPTTKDLYIATKGTSSNLYRLPYPQSIDTIAVLKPVLSMPLFLLTAGDISRDGSKILMKNYGSVYYWQRQSGERIDAALRRTPKLLPYTVEQQGEAIAWSLDGSSYFTTSEDRAGVLAHLWKYTGR